MGTQKRETLLCTAVPKKSSSLWQSSSRTKHPKQGRMLLGLSELTRYGEPGLTVGRSKGNASELGSIAKLLIKKILVRLASAPSCGAWSRSKVSGENIYLIELKSYVCS